MDMKEQIILKVKNLEANIGTEVIPQLFTGRGTDQKIIGANQFREIASLCCQAQCYAELELMIQYKIAKSGDGISWKQTCRAGECFGRYVLAAMQEVKELDETNVLKNIELFFGYLYWQARIWCAQSASQSSPNRNNRNR